jgi:hypothetical protein
MRSDVKVFRLVAAVLAYCLLSTVSTPYLLHSAATHPYLLRSKVEKVAPPITEDGFLYDRATGAILYDAVTLRPIYA